MSRLVRPAVLASLLLTVWVSPAAANTEVGQGVAVSPDGHVVVVGSTTAEGSSVPQPAVAELDGAGSLNPGFGGGDGKVELVIPGGGTALDVVFELDGDLIVLVQRGDGQIGMFKLNPDGSQDADCGGGREINLGQGFVPFALAIGANAIWVVGKGNGVGFSILIEADDCTQDMSAGVTELQVPAGTMEDVTDVAVDPATGQAFVAGRVDTFAGIMNLNPNNTLSTTSGDGDGTDNDGTRLDNIGPGQRDRWTGIQITGGTVRIWGESADDNTAATRDKATLMPVGPNQNVDHGIADAAAGLALLDNGNLLAAGNFLPAGPFGAPNATATVLDANNMPVPGFDGDGKKTLSPGPTTNLAADAAALPGGVGVVAGTAQNTSTGNDDIVVWRLAPDGSDVISTLIDFAAAQDPGPGVPDVPRPELAIDKVLSNASRPGDGGSRSHTVEQGYAVEVEITVKNNSLTDASNVVVTDTLPSGVDFALFNHTLEDSRPVLEVVRTLPSRLRDLQCDHRNTTLTCTIGKLAGGEEFTVFISVYGRVGVSENRATVTSNPGETVTTIGNNVSPPFAMTVTLTPDVDEIDADANGAEGEAGVLNKPDHSAAEEGVEPVMRPAAVAAGAPSARALSKLRRVEVAVLRRGGKRCQWLKSVRGGFKRIKPQRRKCNRGVWLKAKGTRKWRIKFKRSLPPGKYTFYARAVNRGGVRETKFSKRDGNTKKITVRKRRR